MSVEWSGEFWAKHSDGLIPSFPQPPGFPQPPRKHRWVTIMLRWEAANNVPTCCRRTKAPPQTRTNFLDTGYDGAHFLATHRPHLHAHTHTRTLTKQILRLVRCFFSLSRGQRSFQTGSRVPSRGVRVCCANDSPDNRRHGVWQPDTKQAFAYCDLHLVGAWWESIKMPQSHSAARTYCDGCACVCVCVCASAFPLWQHVQCAGNGSVCMSYYLRKIWRKVMLLSEKDSWLLSLFYWKWKLDCLLNWRKQIKTRRMQE